MPIERPVLAIEYMITGFWSNLEDLMDEELPKELGMTATPNELRRQHLRVKSVYDEFGDIMDKIEEDINKGWDFVNKVPASRNKYKASFMAFLREFKKDAKLKIAIEKRKEWRIRLEELEKRLNIDPAMASPSSGKILASDFRSKRRLPNIQLATSDESMESCEEESKDVITDEDRVNYGNDHLGGCQIKETTEFSGLRQDSWIESADNKESISELIFRGKCNPVWPSKNFKEFGVLNDGTHKMNIEENRAKELKFAPCELRTFQNSGFGDKNVEICQKPIAEIEQLGKENDFRWADLVKEQPDNNEASHYRPARKLSNVGQEFRHVEVETTDSAYVRLSFENFRQRINKEKTCSWDKMLCNNLAKEWHELLELGEINEKDYQVADNLELDFSWWKVGRRKAATENLFFGKWKALLSKAFWRSSKNKSETMWKQ